jgi:transcriptional regulator with XRE-family HTH domain
MILGDMIVLWRIVNELSVRQLAKEIGVDFNALNRLERGKPVGLANFITILAWLTKRSKGSA